jgi:hypothetical protein
LLTDSPPHTEANMARAKGGAGDNGEKGPSKMGMVREALQELGDDAKPKAIYDHVKVKHGVDIQPAMISSYKSTIVGKGGGRSGALRTGRGGNTAVSISDLEQVQRLIDRVGANHLQQLIKVLAK